MLVFCTSFKASFLRCSYSIPPFSGKTDSLSRPDLQEMFPVRFLGTFWSTCCVCLCMCEGVILPDCWKCSHHQATKGSQRVSKEFVRWPSAVRIAERLQCTPVR